MRCIIVFILFITAIKPIEGKCKILLHSNDKTQHIYSNIKLDSLCIFNPIVFVALINHEEIVKFDDSLFNTHLSFYEERRVSERPLDIDYQLFLTNYFKYIYCFSLPSLSIEDSIIIYDELKKYEKVIEHEEVDSLPLTERLFNALVKYPTHKYLLTDITLYYNIYRRTNTQFLRIRPFIIDVKNKNVCFYDCKIWKFYYGIKRKRFKELFKGLKGMVPLSHRQLKRLNINK